MPRAPLPPMPERPLPIWQERFDEYYFAGETNAQLTISGFGVLDESWSGYALNRTGESVIPFTIPAVDSSGYTNVTSDTGGAVRFWVKPHWSSQSFSGGTGPGNSALLLELDVTSGGATAYAWSLQITPDGNTMEVLAQTGGSVGTALATSISWQSHKYHCVVLNYTADGSTLYIDGQSVATGSGMPSISASVGELTFGSTIAGGNPAECDLDECASFGSTLTDGHVAMYYQMISNYASLGPESWHELHHHSSESAMSSRTVFDPDTDTGCPTGGVPYLTNFSATLLTNNTTTVSFDLVGGTNGVIYDIYYVTNLATFLDVSTWSWVGQGLTCNGYTFSNQPPDYAFYIAAFPVEPTVTAWGNNSSGQCDVPLGLTNAMAVAGGFNFSVVLRRDGTVIAWGDNTHGQTNVPFGLSNVVAIAAGHTHTVALLANGAVTNWGCYWDGGTNYDPVTNYSAPTSNITAIAASMYHDLALQSNGTVLSWGLTDTVVNVVLTNLTNVQAIDCGWYHNLALLSNGNVVAWGLNVPAFWPLTNVPANLTNAAAIAAGALHCVALRTNGTVESWGWNANKETNTPSGLSNVVAVAAGSDQSLALLGNGRITAWGSSTNFPEATVPTNLYGAKAIACGFAHNLAITSSTLPPVRTEPPFGFALYGNSFTFSVVGLFGTNFSYQWQFNGTNISGATNATLTLSGVNTSDNGNYQAVISNASGTVTSLAASFAMALGPVINSTTPNSGNYWIDYVPTPTLAVSASAVGQLDYPLFYQWQFNTNNVSAATNSYYTIPGLATTNEGNYTVVVTNAIGSTSATWAVRLALPGMVEAWGSDTNGECDRPVTITNVSAIAAGDYHSVAVTDSGTVLQWGKYFDGTNYYSVTNAAATAPPASNIVTVAASLGHDLALEVDGTVTNWGLTNDMANTVPTGLSPAKAVAAGWHHNVVLLTNGTVFAWGDDTYGQTNVPSDLTNATAIAAGEFHSLALRSDGTVEAWGYNTNGQTNVPSGLSNVVAIAAGGEFSIALKSSGCVVAWGKNDFMQTNVPLGLSNVMGIAAGSAHAVALKNDGTLVEWGANSSGQAAVPAKQPTTVITTDTNVKPPFIQTNTYPPIVVKLIAAGGNHTMAAISSPLVQYPVDVSKDLLLIYNVNSTDSSNVCQYYLANRPMVSNANILAINCPTNEQIAQWDVTNIIAQIQNWLMANPTKRPSYMVLFEDMPSTIDYEGTYFSLQYLLNEVGFVQWNQRVTNQYQLSPIGFGPWNPFVTSINMNGVGGTNDCIAYINKLAFIGSNYSPGQLTLSASSGGYGNTNWYFETSSGAGVSAQQGVTNADPAASVFVSSGFITNATNVAGYYSVGVDGLHNVGFATNDDVIFTNNSGWYIMASQDSYNGKRNGFGFQSSFLTWFASNAFGGTNYSNSPVGAISHVYEPYGGDDTYDYYGDWASGKSFAISAYHSFANEGTATIHQVSQATCDPFVRK